MTKVFVEQPLASPRSAKQSVHLVHQRQPFLVLGPEKKKRKQDAGAACHLCEGLGTSLSRTAGGRRQEAGGRRQEAGEGVPSGGSATNGATPSIVLCKKVQLCDTFSPNQPTRPIWSGSCNVCLCVFVFVCPLSMEFF